MGQSNPLDVLKQCFEKIIPSQDARTTINPMEFVVCLVFCYLVSDRKPYLSIKSFAYQEVMCLF